MESLIAHIARKHGLGRENLATDILVQILCSVEVCVLQSLFAHYGLKQSSSSDYQVHTQEKCKESPGIPDIKIDDKDGNTCVIIENKFQAGFTGYQPNSYLKDIDEDGLLLFIVPDNRQEPAFVKLLELCRSSEPTVLSGTRARVDGKFLEVTSWKDTLDTLDKLQQSVAQCSVEQKKRICSDIEQLRRFCQVEEKEIFDDLSPDKISGVGISTLIHHLTWITRELITDCLKKEVVKKRIVSNRSKDSKMGANYDSSLFFGQALLFCGVEIWMGFWALAWEELKTSPLWISLDPHLDTNQLVKQLQENNGEGFVVKREIYGSEYWLIPIPIKPDIPQDQVVEEAFQFVFNLSISIEREQNGLAAKG